MVRFASTMPARSRPMRARRRVLFCAESLESRQLLSVAAFHPTALAPAPNVPAAVGPVVPSSAANAASMATPLASTTPSFQIVLEINPIVTGQAVHGFSETIFIFETPTATGTVPISPSTIEGPSTTAGGSTAPTTGVGPVETPSASNASITPLTAAVLSGPAAGNRAAVVVIVPTQTLVANFAPSTMPVTTQAILATATLEEQPIPPPVLGQGFESGQTQGADPQFDGLFKRPATPIPFEPQLPAIDVIEPYRPAIEEAPAAPPAETEPAPAPPQVVPPVEALPIEPAALADWDQAPEFPVLSPRVEDHAEAQTPSWSMAAMVGTAAIAGGGYHLVLSGSNRFNQRWIPSRRSRGRKNEEN